MKTAIIEELLDPVLVVLKNLSDPEDVAHLKLALNKVRLDMSEFFGEVFDHEDPYEYDGGHTPPLFPDDDSWMKGPS